MYAIIALVYLPCIRIWRSLGYDCNPGVLINVVAAVGIVSYEMVTRYYLVPIVERNSGHWWSARYPIRSTVVVSEAANADA